MIYEFVSKIRDVEDTNSITSEHLAQIVKEVSKKFDDSLDLKFVLPSSDASGEFLVKSQRSVSSMPALHDKELELAIIAFKAYLEEIAVAIEGQVSKKDGFYNNTQTFKRLYESFE